jgi:hypothetical protein
MGTPPKTNRLAKVLRVSSITLIAILAAIAIPKFISLRARPHNDSANSAGRNAKLAEEVWYSDDQGDNPKPYTMMLDDLLSGHGSKAYHYSVKKQGRNAKLAEEVWSNDYQGDNPKPYTTELSDLLSYDKNLTDDTDVTFIFGVCNSSGYTFTLQHLHDSGTYLFTD